MWTESSSVNFANLVNISATISQIWNFSWVLLFGAPCTQVKILRCFKNCQRPHSIKKTNNTACYYVICIRIYQTNYWKIYGKLRCTYTGDVDWRRLQYSHITC